MPRCQTDSVGHRVRDYEYDDFRQVFRLVVVLEKLALASEVDRKEAERRWVELENTFSCPGSQFTG